MLLQECFTLKGVTITLINLVFVVGFITTATMISTNIFGYNPMRPQQIARR